MNIFLRACRLFGFSEGQKARCGTNRTNGLIYGILDSDK